MSCPAYGFRCGIREQSGAGYSSGNIQLPTPRVVPSMSMHHYLLHAGELQAKQHKLKQRGKYKHLNRAYTAEVAT